MQCLRLIYASKTGPSMQCLIADYYYYQTIIFGTGTGH